MVVGLLPPVYNIMKFINLSLLLVLIILGCSQNPSVLSEEVGEDEEEVTQLQIDTIIKQDSILANKLSELEDTILFLESKINLLEEKLEFYSERNENILDIISGNGRVKNEVQERGSQSKPLGQVAQSPQVPKQQPPQAIYDQARSYYVKNDLAKAKRKFTEFINQYPQHDLIINCHYWLAEIDYDQGKYAEAIKKFQAISASSGNQEKAIDSLYKIAFINKLIGNYDLALTQAEAIKTNHPDYIRIHKVKALIKDLK